MLAMQRSFTGARVNGDLAHGKNGGTFRRRRPEPAAVKVEGVRWVCARVQTGREFSVADDLNAMGFRAFCPHGVKVYMRARVHGSEQRKRAERDFPVFGAYLFVGEPAGVFLGKHSHWRIFSVLENAGGSRYVPAAFIEAASKLWIAGKWDGRISASERLTGKRVKIVAGPMQGWEAVVDDLPSELQAMVTIRMFGAERLVTVDIASLEVV